MIEEDIYKDQLEKKNAEIMHLNNKLDHWSNICRVQQEKINSINKESLTGERIEILQREYAQLNMFYNDLKDEKYKLFNENIELVEKLSTVSRLIGNEEELNAILDTNKNIEKIKNNYNRIVLNLKQISEVLYEVKSKCAYINGKIEYLYLPDLD